MCDVFVCTYVCRMVRKKDVLEEEYSQAIMFDADAAVGKTGRSMICKIKIRK